VHIVPKKVVGLDMARVKKRLELTFNLSSLPGGLA